ncbi:MAG: MATE family efflux transporter [Rikenellaceae bacterium]
MATSQMLPLILRFSLPCIAAQLVNLLYSIVDRVFIGHIDGVGSEALAGVGVTTSVIILIIAFSSIVSMGAAPLCAIALGKCERERALSIMGNGVSLLVLFAIVTSAITALFMTPLLTSVGASAQTLPYAEEYLSIYLWGTLFALLSVGLNTFITLQGRADIAMWVVVVGAVMNIALDYTFINIMSMGVGGAALATVISQGVMPILSYNYGTGDVSRVKECFKYSFIIMTLTNLAIILFIIIMPSLVANIFSDDHNLIELTSRVAPIFFFGMTLFGMQRTCQGTFISLGQAKISIFIALLRKVILLIPLIYILSNRFGVMGVYWAESISDGLAAIICLTIFMRLFPRILSKRTKVLN